MDEAGGISSKIRILLVYIYFFNKWWLNVHGQILYFVLVSNVLILKKREFGSDCLLTD